MPRIYNNFINNHQPNKNQNNNHHSNNNKNNNRHIKIAHLNIQSVRNKIDKLKHFVASHGIDIMSLNETFLKPSYSISIPSYNIVRLDRKKRKGGGVCFIIHESIPYDLLSLNLNESDEITAIELPTVLVNGKKLVIASYYNPPNLTVKIPILDQLFSYSQNVILLGDLNAHHEIWLSSKRNESGRIVAAYIEHNDLVLANTLMPTFQPLHNPTYTAILDLSIMSEPVSLNVLAFYTSDSLHSDHIPFIFKLRHDGPAEGCRLLNNKRKSIKVSCCNQELLLEELTKNAQYLVYQEPICTNDIDALASQITELIFRSVNNSTFKKTLNIDPSKYLILPKHIVELIKQKRKLRRRFLKYHDPQLKSQLNALVSQIKTSIREYKSEKWRGFCDSLNDFHISDSKLWEKIRSIDSSKKSSASPTLIYQDKVSSDPKITSNIFADELEKVFQNHASQDFDVNFENIVNDEYPHLFEKTSPHEFDRVDTYDLKKILQKINGKGAAGADKISNKILKQLPFSYLSAIADLANASIKYSHIPQEWKLAIVCMIPKPMKNHRLPASYRPISLLNTLSKLLERIIYARLCSWTVKKQILSEFQCGFTKMRQCKDHVFRLTQDGLQAFNRNMKMGAIFIDIEKAFDRVWHRGLIYRLHELRIPVYLGAWIKSYLKNRKFQVKVSGEISSIKNINAGVPQGSILGPILFNIYFNSIVTELVSDNRLKIAVYADDLAFWVISEYTKILIKHLQVALNNLYKWMSKYRMVVSEQKSIITLFQASGKKASNTLTVFYNGKQIMPENNPRFLGTTLDTNFNFHRNTELIVLRANNRLNMLRRLKGKDWGASPFLIITSFKMLICSLIDFSSLTIPVLANPWLKKLEVIQRNAIRIAYRCPPRTSCDSILAVANMTTILERSIKLCDRYFSKSLKYNNTIIKKQIEEYMNNIDLQEGGIAKKSTPIRATILGALLINEYSKAQDYLVNLQSSPTQLLELGSTQSSTE